MKTKYDSTKKFWDKIFSKSGTVNPTTPIGNIQLEESIEWVSQESMKLLDFGCGSGRVLLRSSCFGVEHMYGVDISEKAISCAYKNVNKYELEEKATFEIGGLEKLKAIETSSYDGAILFNIIDNLFPVDAMTVLDEIRRVVKENGKVLVKFNPYIEKKLREEYEFIEVEEEFYKETTGLYLWNLTDEKIRDILQQYFDIEKEIIVEYPEHNQINRMFYLWNR